MAPAAAAASPALPSACGARCGRHSRRRRCRVPEAPSAALFLGRPRRRSSSPPPVRAASQPLSLTSLMQRIAPGQPEAVEGSSAEENVGDREGDATELALERRSTAHTSVGSAVAGYITHTLRRTTRPARAWLGRAVPRATSLPLPSGTEVAKDDAFGGPSDKSTNNGQETMPDIRRFLRPVTNSELGVVRKFASLSAFAYLIESVTDRSLNKSHRLKLVTTSLAKRLAEVKPGLDRARLAEALLVAPAAPPWLPAHVNTPAASSRGPLPAVLAARPQPNALQAYLLGPGQGQQQAPQATDADTEAERALTQAVADILSLADRESAATAAAEAQRAAEKNATALAPPPPPPSSLPWPLSQRPVVTVAKKAARMARSVARPVAATASPMLSSATVAVANLAAAAAPLITAAAAGSGVAAAALAAAAGPLAATAAAGSSVAAQALGGIIDPVAGAAAAGGSAAGGMLTSITGSIAAAAASAATRVTGSARSGRRDRASSESAAGGDAGLALQASTATYLDDMASSMQLAGRFAARTGTVCPCEWYVADDERTATRVFVIQGSDSVASWRSNLAFDPVVFEADALHAKVHRGVYEAACALYDTLQPLIDDHLASHRKGQSRLAFTGHSLGGSLATLMMLMLALRRPELLGSLDPVYTYGAPSVFCDECCGDCTEQRIAQRARRALEPLLSEGEGEAGCCRGVLEMLGLPRNHVRNVMMHLDIVPRAFACDYRLVQAWLRRIGGSFRDHGCLQGESNVSLYLPAGITMVLQPNENAAAQHAMLPPGSGLYLIDDPLEPFWNAVSVPWALGGNGGAGGGAEDSWMSDDDAGGAEGRDAMDARAALSALLNSPHPLDILADVAAYGPQGTVSLYHNPFNYVRALRNEAARRTEWRRGTETGVKRAALWAGGVLGATAHRIGGILPFVGGGKEGGGVQEGNSQAGGDGATVAR